MSGIFSNVLILSDFDGTFAGKRSRIIKRNIDAINAFKAEGGHFTFSTGRLPAVMRSIFPEFGSLINAPAIMCNGNFLYDSKTDKYIYETFFDGIFGRQLMIEIAELYPDFSLVVYSDDGLLRKNYKPHEIPGNKWRKIRFSGNNENKIIDLRDHLNNKYGDKIRCIRSCPVVGEIVDKSVNKGNLIELEHRYFASIGLPDIKVYCIGDYENDLEMLSAADCAFCPANAIESVKQLCKYIVCDHDKGAVADMIDIIRKIQN